MSWAFLILVPRASFLGVLSPGVPNPRSSCLIFGAFYPGRFVPSLLVPGLLAPGVLAPGVLVSKRFIPGVRSLASLRS
jgi:hypothetical protein